MKCCKMSFQDFPTVFPVCTGLKHVWLQHFSTPDRTLRCKNASLTVFGTSEKIYFLQIVNYSYVFDKLFNKHDHMHSPFKRNFKFSFMSNIRMGFSACQILTKDCNFDFFHSFISLFIWRSNKKLSSLPCLNRQYSFYLPDFRIF